MSTIPYTFIFSISNTLYLMGAMIFFTQEILLSRYYPHGCETLPFEVINTCIWPIKDK